jgi:hypothetical protein
LFSLDYIYVFSFAFFDFRSLGLFWNMFERWLKPKH